MRVTDAESIITTTDLLPPIPAAPTREERQRLQAVGRRVLVVCQTFPPDPAAVGQCVADVCETLASRGAAVSVIAANRGYHDPSMRFAARASHASVDVHRVSVGSFGKTSLVTRLVGSLLFVANATVRGLVGRRPDVILVSTVPPMAPLAALVVAALRRSTVVHWLMDLNPDQAIAAGLVRRSSINARLLDWLNCRVLRRCQTLIVLDAQMAERFTAKTQTSARLLVIPPWGGITKAVNRDPSETAFRAANGLLDRFVVMYSGNHSLVHPLETLLDAAEQMQDDPRFVFVFVGDGHGKTSVEDRGLPNVVSLPYQPRETLADSLSAADLHVVTMGDNMVGVVHPSKIYGVLAVGRPVLFIGPATSHVAEIVKNHRLGWSLRHGDVDGVTAALRSAVEQTPAERATVSGRARAALEQAFDPSILRERVADAVLEAISRR
ncbi:MAG: glycosyltransferase family 4 protein [Gemmatimonadaceae bacterium]